MKIVINTLGNRHRKLALNILSIVASVAIIYFLIIKIENEKELIDKLRSIDPRNLIILVFIWLIMLIPNSINLKLITNHFGIKLSFWDWFGLNIVSNILNLFMPARGDYLFSAIYLNRKYKLPITKFGSMVYINALLTFGVLSIQCILALIYIGLTTKFFSNPLWFILLALTLMELFLVIGAAWLKKLRTENWLLTKLRILLENGRDIIFEKVLFIKLIVVMAMSAMLFIIWMFFSFKALGSPVNLFSGFLIGVFTQISFLVNFSPGNLGIREAISGFSSQILGMDFSTGVAVALLQRAVTIAGLLIMGIIFIPIIVPSFLKIKENEKQKDD